MGPYHPPLSHIILLPIPITTPIKPPFARAKSTIIAIPTEDRDKYDVYINNTIAIALDLPGNSSRIAAAIPLTIHNFYRPLSTQEPTPRSNPISTSKLTAEGAIEEVKVMLGWTYNTQSLIISLPNQKYTALTHDLEQLLLKGTSSHNEIDTIIGRLNHVAYVIPTDRHFLSRIQNFKFSLQFCSLGTIPRLVK